ncbi:pentapeptide repeat-containing protein [Frankia sp. CiP1_Cm_nod2]|uniref:pentapeptide repeat-containing protein n=1 Tax=Frankia sp. CiP1_Cm_nod2 TaxID=2897161 RepID=UPI002025AC0C
MRFPGPAGATASAAAGVTVLHLPRLRMGRTDMDVARFADLLATEVEETAAGWGDYPDLVVATGNIAEHGRRSEYEQAVDLFDTLLNRWGLGRSRLAVVPGDRDVNRAACRSYFDSCEADEEEPAVPYWPKWRHFERMFTSFYGPGPAATFAVGQEWTLFPLEDLKIVVAGLNSTIGISHRDGEQQGRIGAAQAHWFAERLADYQRRGWLRIAAVHHNLDLATSSSPEVAVDAAAVLGELSPRLNLLLAGCGSQQPPGAGEGCLFLPVPVSALSEGIAACYQLARIDRKGVDKRLRVLRTGDLRAGGEEQRWTDEPAGQPARNTARTGTTSSFWTAADTTFPPEPDTAAGEPDKARGRYGEAVEEIRELRRAGVDDGPDSHRRFLSRVAEVTRLRHAGQLGEANVLEMAATVDGPSYLRVTCREGTVVTQHPVGVLEGDPDQTAVETFVRRVHRGYAATDPQLVSDLVYGGRPPEQGLVETTWRQGVRLISFVEYQGLMDLRDYTATQTVRLENDPLYRPDFYLPQRFRRLDTREPVAGTDALGQVVDWLASDQPQFVLLLGDFGRGKTFLLHELARTLPDRLGHVIPLLVELRHLEKSHGVDELVAAHLLAAGVTRFDRERFRYMLRHGRIALLFDGFDELALRVTYERAADHLSTLLDALDGQAKIVLTSRSQHFRSDQQVRTALARRVDTLTASRVVGLEDFTDGQIEEFLTRFYNGDRDRAAGRLALIHDIRDLLGLSRNPRMLGFIARLDEQRLRAAQARTGTITSADLYKELLNLWLDFESKRARPSGAAPALTTDDRWQALTALAVKLWQTTDRTISVNELATTTGRVLTSLDAHGIEEGQAAHQVGSGTLLVRTGEDTFAFIHASVMEYLLAAACAPQLRAGTADEDLLALRPISTLMTDFVIGLAGKQATTRWARTVLTDPTATHAARANALGFARVLDPALARGAKLVGASLPGISLAGLDLTGADLSGADLTDAQLAGTTLQHAHMRQSRLNRANFTDVDLSGADLTRADLTSARLVSCTLTGVTLTASDWSRAVLLGCHTDSAALDSPELHPAAVTGRDEPTVVTPPANFVRAVAFSPDGTLLAYASGNAVVLADPNTATILRVATAHTGIVNTVVFSPDGTLLASASNDGTVRIWETTTGTCQHTLTDHTNSVETVVFSPDGTLLASASNDGTVRVWETTTGTCQHTLTDHTNSVETVVFSPDGTLFASASASSDNTVRIWETATGQPVTTLVTLPADGWAILRPYVPTIRAIPPPSTAPQQPSATTSEFPTSKNAVI